MGRSDEAFAPAYAEAGAPRVCNSAGPSKANSADHRAEVGHYWIVDPVEETLAVHRWHEAGYLEVLVADRADRVRAEPFDGMEFTVGVLFGDEAEE